MVFNGTENFKLSHNHNIVNFISNRPGGGRPLKYILPHYPDDGNHQEYAAHLNSLYHMVQSFHL